MKQFIQSMMKKTKTFSVVDYGVIKACIFVFGLWIATLLPVVTTINPWIYGIVWSLLYIYLIWRIWFKK